jgi:acyl-coenzyme A thioesterase PaaI-like protein
VRDVEQPVSAARVRLNDATRALMEMVVDADAVADDDLAATAAAIEAATTSLRNAAAAEPEARGLSRRTFPEYLARNRLIGVAHPMSPAASWDFTDGVLQVWVTFGDAYEGPQGFVHGGVVALAFDELLALAGALGGEGGVTGTLKVRYRKPTPLHEELRMTGWIEHRQGRRLRARGTIHAADALTAEAEGLFIAAEPHRRRASSGD